MQRCPPNSLWTLPFGGALWLIALWLIAALVGCQREPSEAPSAGGGVVEAARPEDPKTAVAVERLDQIGVAMEKLVAKAEQASGDGPALLAIQAEFQIIVADANRDLGGADRAMTAEQRRAVQAYYGSRIAPLHARLQVLLFPAALVELPRGATPGLIPAALPSEATAATPHASPAAPAK